MYYRGTVYTVLHTHLTHPFESYLQCTTLEARTSVATPVGRRGHGNNCSRWKPRPSYYSADRPNVAASKPNRCFVSLRCPLNCYASGMECLRRQEGFLGSGGYIFVMSQLMKPSSSHILRREASRYSTEFIIRTGLAPLSTTCTLPLPKITLGTVTTATTTTTTTTTYRRPSSAPRAAGFVSVIINHHQYRLQIASEVHVLHSLPLLAPTTCG